MLLSHSPEQSALRKAINDLYRADETNCVNALLKEAILPQDVNQRIEQTAYQLVAGMRDNPKGKLAAFLHEYDLSSEEGIALMCLAEALLRIPDKATINKLITDKISTVNWQEHLDSGSSLFINAATWSLVLTGKLLANNNSTEESLGKSLKNLFSRISSSMIRPIVLQSMKIIGKQFVMGETIEKALERAKKYEARGYRYSYDMLGEAARTKEDAMQYYQAYQDAIAAIGAAATSKDPIQNPGISVKLSALHPRYEIAKRERLMQELVPLLLELAKQAKAAHINFTVDAEEADRLDLSLDIIEAVFANPALSNWDGFGLAVQAYQKRAPRVIDWLIDLSRKHQRRIPIRLIKGAYWDTEIKISQIFGFENYPVFTRKNSTDVSYIACAKKILAHPDCFYPQFGSHNAHTVATIMELTKNNSSFEFQGLHGMAQPLYDQIVGKENYNVNCRIYAPVGSHKNLLGYLVRRLLENGANSSFVNCLADPDVSIEKIIQDPVKRMTELHQKTHPAIPLPKDIYSSRKNSSGIDLSNIATIKTLKTELETAAQKTWQSCPIISGANITRGTAAPVVSPSNPSDIVGQAYKATVDDVEAALHAATLATQQWGKTPVAERAAILERAADLFEKNMPTLIMLLCREAGKHIVDCVSEVRETVDYCRYYAERARKDCVPQALPGPTGEWNQLTLHPRGIIATISPWNFPLAIFIGQVTAALAAGNCVIAKPAEQTPLIAAYAVRILHEAGIPVDALQYLPGAGSVVGAKLTADNRVDGVMLTGSTETAKIIQQAIANRSGPIVPFIAETGGQNTMIVDSTALPEQVVQDVIQSAFNSAGQRCSALRVLFLQEDVAESILTMLIGAMSELTIGDPSLLATDIGPVIDKPSRDMLQQHYEKMCREAKLLYQVPLNKALTGHFFAPCVFELENLSLLQREVFGPILHVIRFPGKKLDRVLSDITQTGYGLTLGIHSRIDTTVNHILSRMPVGNFYVNRNIIGAVVGVQPFGGERLSGTGPKAGGPHYLPHLCVERTVSINTTAAGGNASLVSLREED